MLAVVSAGLLFFSASFALGLCRTQTLEPSIGARWANRWKLR